MSENSLLNLKSPQKNILKIGAVVPFAATDYPGHLSAVLFCQGCPWRCRYCHNPHLQPMQPGALEWPRIIYFLHARKKLLDAVVFSGGEPLIQPNLPQAMSEVKALGFKIGLHTGGACVEQFKKVLPLVDWVGFDVKAPFNQYERITKIPNSGSAAKECLQLLVHSKVSFQLRTTVHPLLLSDKDLAQIKEEVAQIAPLSSWVLQPFRSTGCVDTELY